MTKSVNLAATIAPRSDQQNADDFLSGPRTVTVTYVRAADSIEQPVLIGFEGDDGRPWKPCKSMRRVLVQAWGAEGLDYVGRQLTLFCDPTITFGGMQTGGIRISHMSHIERALHIPLTKTRGKKAVFSVQALPGSASNAPREPRQPLVDRLIEAMAAQTSNDDLVAWHSNPKVQEALARLSDADKMKFAESYNEALSEFPELLEDDDHAEAIDDDGWPDDEEALAGDEQA